MEKKIYQKPEVFVVNAEPEMLLAGSIRTEGNNPIGGANETINSINSDAWTTSDNSSDNDEWDF